MIDDAEPSGRPRARLDREQIVRAACTIGEREGASAVTMRRLGTELAADPTAVYHWFASKSDLFAAMADHYFSEILDVYRDDSSWRENVTASAWAGRQVFRRNPGFLQALADLPDDSPCLTRIAEREIGYLLQAGLAPADAARAHHALDDLVTGSGLFLAVAPELATPERRRDIRNAVAALPAAEYPNSVAVSEHLFGDVDEIFGYQLELLLDGIERVAQSPDGREHER
jgi:AcrR family transcriptional regulator